MLDLKLFDAAPVLALRNEFRPVRGVVVTIFQSPATAPRPIHPVPPASAPGSSIRFMKSRIDSSSVVSERAATSRDLPRRQGARHHRGTDYAVGNDVGPIDIFQPVGAVIAIQLAVALKLDILPFERPVGANWQQCHQPNDCLPGRHRRLVDQPGQCRRSDHRSDRGCGGLHRTPRRLIARFVDHPQPVIDRGPDRHQV